MKNSLKYLFGVSGSLGLIGSLILSDHISQSSPKQINHCVTNVYCKSLYGHSGVIQDYCVEYVVAHGPWYYRDVGFNGTFNKVILPEIDSMTGLLVEVKREDSEFEVHEQVFYWATNLTKSSKWEISAEKLRKDYDGMIQYAEKFNFSRRK